MKEIYVGSKTFQVSDSNGIKFPVLINYPTNVPSTITQFGPYPMDVSRNAGLPEGGTFPLIIISHGNSGSHLLYRTISTYLAKSGYIVAMPEHHGNNRNDNSLANSVENLQLRPYHISLTIDFISDHDDFRDKVACDKVAVIGHSFGGYTALAVAGGNPSTESGEKVVVKHDARVKALVLMAPATGWFIPEASLKEVTTPILMYSAEHDPHTPLWNALVVINGVSDKNRIIHEIVPNGGHFSFLSPFPAAMQRPDFPPSTDPAGFDREAFHLKLRQEILNFLNQTLVNDMKI